MRSGSIVLSEHEGIIEMSKRISIFKQSYSKIPLLPPFTKKCVHAKSLQSCPTLRDSMDCSPPGSSVHGILQARILEWVAIPFSRGSSWPKDQKQVFCICRRILDRLSHQGNLMNQKVQQHSNCPSLSFLVKALLFPAEPWGSADE